VLEAEAAEDEDANNQLLSEETFQELWARLVYKLKSSDHVTPVLKDLHWLQSKECVVCILCMLVHSVSTHLSICMSDKLTACADMSSLTGLHTSSSADCTSFRRLG